MTEKEDSRIYETEMTPRGLKLKKCHLESPEIILPEKIDGEELRIIGQRAFAEEAQFTEKIRIPSSVRLIEPYAFDLCLSLREVILEEGVRELGREWLISTRVEKVFIPSTVRKIHEPGALSAGFSVDEKNPVYFSDDYGLYRRLSDSSWELETVNPRDHRQFYAVLEGCVSFSSGALEEHDYLESLLLPSTLNTLPPKALINSANPYARRLGIRRILIAEGNSRFFEREGGIYEKLDEGRCRLLRYLGNEFEFGPAGDVCQIASYAFIHSQLRHITVPSSVDLVDPEAFIGCHVRDIYFEKEKLLIRFPKNHEHRLYGLLKSFGQNGCLYDFHYYDHFLTENTEPLDADRLRMICCRLENDRDMTDEVRQRIEEKVRDNFSLLMAVAGEENDLESLEKMCRLGFFNRENLGEAIRILSEKGRKEAMAMLMDYQYRHFPPEDFDFSL